MDIDKIAWNDFGMLYKFTLGKESNLTIIGKLLVSPLIALLLIFILVCIFFTGTFNFTIKCAKMVLFKKKKRIKRIL